MKKRFFALLIALLIVLCCHLAFAQTYPARRGAVNDDATVLSTQTAKDVDTLNSRSGASFTVVTRHFLGGADAQQYCDALFESWNLKQNDVLLLLVIGEERYAVTLGSRIASESISQEQLNSLLSAKLRPLFLQNRDYDGAVGAFLTAAAQEIARAEGVSLNTSGLFGNTQQQSASGTQSSGFGTSWNSSWSSFFSDNDLSEITSGGDYAYKKDSGFSKGKLIAIVIIVVIILRNRHRKNRGQNGGNGFGRGGAADGVRRNLRRPR